MTVSSTDNILGVTTFSVNLLSQVSSIIWMYLAKGYYFITVLQSKQQKRVLALFWRPLFVYLFYTICGISFCHTDAAWLGEAVKAPVFSKTASLKPVEKYSLLLCLLHTRPALTHWELQSCCNQTNQDSIYQFNRCPRRCAEMHVRMCVCA